MNYFEIKGNDLTELNDMVKTIVNDFTELFNDDLTLKTEKELEDSLFHKQLFAIITRNKMAPYSSRYTAASYQHYLGSILRDKFPGAPSKSIVSSKKNGIFHHVCDIDNPSFLIGDYNHVWNNEYEFVFIPSFFISLYRLFTLLYSKNSDGMDAFTQIMIGAEISFCLLFLENAKRLYDPRVFFGIAVIVQNWVFIEEKITDKKLIKKLTEIMNLCQCDSSADEEGPVNARFVDIPQQYKKVFRAYSADVETAYIEYHYYVPSTSEDYLEPTKLLDITDANRYRVLLTKSALKQEKKLLSPKGPIHLRKPIKVRLNELSVNPHTTRFKFERLKNNWAGYCSIRVTEKDRIVYKIDELAQKIVKIYTLYKHYEL